MTENNNVLITCGGKWVGIVLQLREAMRRNRELKSGQIVVVSSDELTPAGCFADAAEVVPPIKAPDYVDKLLSICQRRSVRIVIPLIDLDLERLTPHLHRFSQIDTAVICPPPEMVELCLDKLEFARFASANGLRHPLTSGPENLGQVALPAFYKKRRGFGSIGSGVCRSLLEAAELVAAAPDLIFQEYLPAREITVDAYISREGKCIVCVPRIRDKVVAGESYKTHTIRRPAVADLAMRTISALSARGLRGPLNVQIFDTDPPCLVEVNTRLGSACVLSNMASRGRLLDALLTEAIGGIADGEPQEYVVGMALSRFLGDVFHSGPQVIDIKPH